MSASPARHRVMQIDAADAPTEFWAARALVDSAESTGLPRHARKLSPRSALNVGRVGALAVSLGIGLGIASAATGVAFAETDTDSTSAASSAPSAGPSAKPVKSRTSKATSATETGTPADSAPADDADADADADDADQDNPQDDDDSDTDLGGDTEDIDETDTDIDTEAESESVTIGTGAPAAGGETTDPNQAPVPADAVLPVVTGGTTTVPTGAAPTGNTTGAVPGKVDDADVVGSTVATLVAPLVTSKQAASPLTDTLLTYIRRILSHTFSNKTPVVNGVNVTTLLGVATITIDAYDPNGDPLTYEIVSGSGPLNGLLLPGIIPGTFIYTADPLKLLQGPVQDTFTIKIRDDSEHLPGSLGGIQRLFESLARAFGFAQRDNYDQVVALTVNPLIDLPGAPPLVVTIGGTTYRLGSTAVTPLTSVSITDIDSGNIKGATVKVTKTDLLTPNVVSGDVLGFTDTDKITGSFDPDTGVLTLTGIATKAEYEAALESVTFTATQVIDGLLGLVTVGRTLTVVVTDDSNVSNSLLPGTAFLSVDRALPGSKPVITVSGSTPKFVLGKGAVAALTSVSISDTDSTKLTGAKVTVTAAPLLVPTFVSGDKLNFSDTGMITGSYNPNTGVLTLTGTATLAEYQAALQSITFSATQGGGILDGLADRTVTVTVTDDGATSATSEADSATVKVANPAPPSVSLSGAIAKFILGKSPVAPLPSVTITDSDSTLLSGAKVTVQGLTLGIPSGYIAGDALGFTNGNGISVLSNSGGVLTLTGSASLAAYQAALQSITFSATQGGGLLDVFLDRRITVTVTDEIGATSDADSATVKVAKPASPSLSLSGTDVLGVTSTVGVNKAPERLIESATIDDSDSDMLSKAVVAVKLLAGEYVSGDALTYVNANGITMQTNTSGVLTLTGNATKAAYKAALESITFKATSGGGLFGAPLPRTLTVTLTDDSGLTGSQTMTVFLSVLF